MLLARLSRGMPFLFSPLRLVMWIRAWQVFYSRRRCRPTWPNTSRYICTSIGDDATVWLMHRTRQLHQTRRLRGGDVWPRRNSAWIEHNSSMQRYISLRQGCILRQVLQLLLSHCRVLSNWNDKRRNLTRVHKHIRVGCIGESKKRQACERGYAVAICVYS